MRRQKTINTAFEIKGVLFMVDEAKKKFPSTTKLGRNEFINISLEVQGDYKRKMSESSVRRIFKLKENPHPLKYETLDSFTVWCFDNEYSNFKKFLDENKSDIEQSNLISEEELRSTLRVLNGAKTKKIQEGKPLVIQLTSTPFELQLNDGSTQKLFKEIASVTGNLLKEHFINDSVNLMPNFGNNRIRKRIELQYERQQNNIENIVAKAVKFVRQKESSDEPVDPDWIIEFFDIAQDCSNENMQYLWAKILAGEVVNPSSFSKRTLNTLKSISKEEAALFTKLSNCLWTLDGKNASNIKMLIKDSDENNEYTDFYWGFDRRDLYLLEDIGLIEESIYILNTKKYSYNFKFFNIKHSIKSSKKRTELDIIRLTKVGEEIYSIVQKTMNEEYYEHIKDYFQKNGIID